MAKACLCTSLWARLVGGSAWVQGEPALLLLSLVQLSAGPLSTSKGL